MPLRNVPEITSTTFRVCAWDYPYDISIDVGARLNGCPSYFMHVPKYRCVRGG